MHASGKKHPLKNANTNCDKKEHLRFIMVETLRLGVSTGFK